MVGLKGQTPIIDSLSKELQVASLTDSSRLGIYLQLSESYVYYNRDSMLHYAIKGEDLALELGKKSQYLYAMQRRGVYYYANSELDEAMRIFNKGLFLSREFKFLERESAFLGSIGIAKFQMGQTDSAVYFLEAALEADRKQEDTIKMIVRLNNLGAVVLAMEQPAQSLKYIYRSLQLALAIGNREKAAFAANNIAVIYQRYDSKEKSIYYFQIALDNMDSNNLGRKALLSNIGELHLSMNQIDSAEYFYQAALNSPGEDDCDFLTAYAGLIDIYTLEKDYEKAAYYVQEGLKKVQTCNDSSYLFDYYYVAGRLALRQKDFSKAEELLEIAKDFGDREERGYMHMFKDLANLSKFKGDFKKAYRYMKRHSNLQQKWYEAKYNREVARSDLEVAFEEEKQAFMEDQASMEEELSYFQDLRVVWTIATVFFLVTLIILFRSFRKGQKTTKHLQELNEVITEQKENLQSKSEQLALSNERIKELSEFRERLAAMAVHDMKGPLSTIIGMSDGTMTAKKQGLIKKAGHQMLNFLMDLLDIYKFEQANIALKLLPHSLYKLVNESIASVDFLAAEKGISFDKNIPEDLIVPVDDGIVVRVITNLLSNAIKYSGEQTKVTIEAKTKVTEGRPYLTLKIQDQGKGLSQEELEHMFKPMNLRKDNYISKSTSTGIGLDFCKLAIQAHRGKIWAQSQPDFGTSIFIELPLHEVVQQDLRPRHDYVDPDQVAPQMEDFSEELLQLSKYQVFEAGEILPILHEMEEQGADNQWLTKIKASVYSSDDALYRELLNKAGQHEV